MALLRLRSSSGAVAALFGLIADRALWLGWLVAAVCMSGSLYYSLVAHYNPCELCWYQRICMYPLALVLLIAALRPDRQVWRYVVPPAVIGAVIAAYHVQLQAFPKQTTFCGTTDPCTPHIVWRFGFISLPVMALAGFAFILTMVLAARHVPVDNDASLPLAGPASDERQAVLVPR